MSSVLSLLPVFCFLLVGIVVAFAVRRRSVRRNAEDFEAEYFIGNRSLGGFVLAITTVATYGSVSSFVGGPGQAWNIGFGWVYMAVVQVTALILLYGIVGKKIALVSRRIDAITIIDVIRHRYRSNLIAVIAGIVIVVFFMAIMVAQFVGGAKVFAWVTGFSYQIGIVIFGITAIAFTVIGGFRGVAFTDVLCGIMMIVGLLVLTAGMMHAGGGLGSIMDTISTNHPEMLEPLSGGNMPIGLYLTQWLLVGLFTFCLPQSTVRCIGAKDAASMHRAMVVGTVVIGFMMILSTVLGVFAAGLLTDDLSAYGGSIDNIIPITIASTLSPLLAGVAIIGPIAASISTVSSLLIVCTSSLMRDITRALRDMFKHQTMDGLQSGHVGVLGDASRQHVNGVDMANDADGLQDSCADTLHAGTDLQVSTLDVSNGASLLQANCADTSDESARTRRFATVSQLVTICIAIVVFLLALVPPSVIWKINMFAFGGLESAFCWVLVMGLFWKRASKAGALASMVGGVAAYCITMGFGITFFGMHQILFGILVSLFCMVLVSLIAPDKGQATHMMDIDDADHHDCQDLECDEILEVYFPR